MDMKEGDHKRPFRNKVLIPRREQRDDSTIYEHYTLKDYNPSESDYQFIKSSLKVHFAFYMLSQYELNTLAAQFKLCSIPPKTVLFEQNSSASSFFLVHSGEIHVIINNVLRRTQKRGDGFGELALLYNAPRSGQCESADMECEMWVLNRSTFKKVVEEVVTQELQENRQFIEYVQLFQQLTVAQKNAISAVIMPQKFRKGQTIVSVGDDATSFYIVKQGSVKVLSEDGKEVRRLYQYESFGEQALLQQKSVRQMTIEANEDSILLALGRDIIQKILGDQVQSIIYRNIAKWTLEKSAIFNQLTLVQLERILDLMQKVQFQPEKSVIFKHQFIDRYIYILLEGEAQLNGKSYYKGQLLNDQYFDQTQDLQKQGNEIKTITDSVFGIIENQQIEKQLGMSIQQLIEKNKAFKLQQSIENTNKKIETMKLQLNDLQYLKKLGSGQFGSVFLVQTNNTKYALKVINRKNVEYHSLEQHIQQEHQALNYLDFPFIMHYYRSFKDDINIYFLLEHISGIELFDAIREIGLLGTIDAQFYIASMILICEYMHSKSVIYRDLKPENLMVDQTGYLKLIDMGTAKIMNQQTRTYSIIGTPHYMAPEIINGKGYNYLVDLWSIGICLYEFMCGFVPFGEDAEDPFEIYEDVIKKHISYPDYLEDKKAKKLMEQLLSKIPEIRLGGGYNQLKRNQWFNNFDWDQLLEIKLQAPLIPQLQQENLKGVSIEYELQKEAQQMMSLIQKQLLEGKKKPRQNMQDDWDKDF